MDEARVSHPDCPHVPARCRITLRSHVQEPVIAWAPEYDGHGVLTNADPNTYVTEFDCSVCGGAWRSVSSSGAPPVISITRPARRG